MKAKNALSLLLAAGMVTPAIADTSLPVAPKGVASGARVMGHIYVNVATGEKIATGMSAAPRGTLPPEVWVSDNDVPCADVNSTGVYDIGFVGVHDDPADTTDTAFNATYLNWGDIAADSVVDTIQVTTYCDHPDVDADSDGLADGVEGLACTWTFVDGDNGFNSCTTRLGLVALTLTTIPGNLDPSLIEGYIYTLDLAGDFSEDISFEIGDSDGDLQGAAVHNAFANAGDALDLDVDGLADFAYGIRYTQPGVEDFDGDGNPDGDPTNVAVTYSSLSAPRMDVAVDPPLAFTIDPISAGNEDAFDIIVGPYVDGVGVHFGTFWYGGFTCDDNANGVYEGNVNSAGANDYNPYASFFMAMYAGDVQPPVCRADLFPVATPDGTLNFFDLSTFLGYFNSQNPIADFFPVAAGDGLFNFFDISTYISEFNAGCP
jgi:hypothetical protein